GVFVVEDDQTPLAYVVQGKYGVAGTGLDVYSESRKFLNALKQAKNGISVTVAIDKIAGVLNNSGLVRYIIATLEPLSQTQQQDLANVKKIANHDFGDQLVIDAISLDNVYNVFTSLEPAAGPSITVDLSCQYLPVQENAYVGVVSLVDIYRMLRNYAKQSDGTIDSIYDHNIRKYLRRRTGSVNDGIYKTLEKEPEHFIAYNNGITIICRSAQSTPTGLRLQVPYVVNGCQTTRTLYDFMDTKFPGVDIDHIASESRIQPYKDAHMAIKILVVRVNNGDAYANDITRFSNKQNAIRGKDFIALEKMYRDFKAVLENQGYFLEIQAGEYDVLPKRKKIHYPKDTHVVSSFEATLFYAAGILGRPNDAFGRSGDFMPGGEKFDEVAKNLTADDLLVPWLVASTAKEALGYTAQARHNPRPGTEHRAQTRFLFLYFFFLLAQNVLTKLLSSSDYSRYDLYKMLKEIKEDYDRHPESGHPFYQLLSLTDEAVVIYMALAEGEKWYTDRNSFLKREELIKQDRITQAMAPITKIKIVPVADQIKQILINRSHDSF
ncbi:MAG TPA: AIPR family protein, partial [Ktedonobacteraceae bacterium]|nr:AIPR family protein [Ktedonobacteraceae bacterium]